MSDGAWSKIVDLSVFTHHIVRPAGTMLKRVFHYNPTKQGKPSLPFTCFYLNNAAIHLSIQFFFFI